MGVRIRRALVTGASSGIGESLARALAARGVSLTVVARQHERLARLAGELPVDVEVLQADLTDPQQRLAVELRLAALDDPVDLLVNNAGFGAYGAVHDIDVDRQSAMIDLHVTSVVRLTHAVLPQLLARDTGGIIQMGSVTAYQPNPYAATYGATKAFLRSFTQALQIELKGTQVHALLVSPATTRTGFFDEAGLASHPIPDAVILDPDDVAAETLEAFARRRPTCVPGAASKALVAGASAAPARLTAALSGLVHRQYRQEP